MVCVWYAIWDTMSDTWEAMWDAWDPLDWYAGCAMLDPSYATWDTLNTTWVTCNKMWDTWELGPKVGHLGKGRYAHGGASRTRC